MAVEAPTRVTRAGKQDRVVQALRHQIVTGQLKPRTQLPNQIELVRRFKVSTVTIQRALERLARDGFVVSQPRQGVFVGSHPPHLVDYCLVFPHDATQLAQTNRFLFSLSQIAAGLSAQGHRRASIYHGIEDNRNSQAYRDLIAQVEGYRTAGLIFLSRPTPFLDTPLMTTPGMPRVAIMGGPLPGVTGVTAVQLGSYLESAIGWFAEMGCRRLAMITVPEVGESELIAWMRKTADRGMTMPRHRILSVSRHDPHWAQHAVRTLMDYPAEQRPDGLVITDDNLVPQATAGLLAAGIRVPEDCRVVAHGNFPWPTESLVPAKRFGPDTREVLTVCLDAIDRARRGEAMPPRVVVPIVSEETFRAGGHGSSEPAMDDQA